jgi:hypothetical protein
LPSIVSRLPSLILKALLRRGTAAWLFVRFMGVAVFGLSASFGGDGSSELIPFWVLVMTPAVVLLDLQRRKEIALLHNLGVTHAIAVAVERCLLSCRGG